MKDMRSKNMHPGLALLIIDMQKGFEEIAASGARRNNPDAEENVAILLDRFRAAGVALAHVRHASLEENSVFRFGRSGFQPMECAREWPGEAIVVKHVNSSFIGTDLEARLRQAGIEALVIAGATTNHCVETTARMAGNLGFRTYVVRDAAFTFDRPAIDGGNYAAEDIHAMSLSNLAGEFAQIVTTTEIVARLSSKDPALF